MNRNALNTAGAVQREAQIPQALDVMEKAINEAEQAFASLVQRCESVQRAVPPTTQDINAKPVAVESLCPLAERIRNGSERIFGLSYIMTGLMSRIEL